MIKMIRPVMIIFLFFLSLGVTRTVSAQSKKRRNAAQPSEITVTLKMEWNVTVVGKSIPADYITKVKNGTVLEDILNKAADEDSQGPFNKYDSTYHAGLGYSITAMNGIKHSTGTYWLIFDEQTGGGIPCGITSYVPQDNSTTIFRLTATFGHSGSVSGYCKLASSNSQVPASLITVTIALDWDVERVGKPIPAPYTTQVANGTVLEDILNKAADENPKGPFNKYETTYHSGLGYSITAINGTEQDPQMRTYWIIYDKKTGKPTPHGVDQFKPKHNSVIIFRLEEILSHGTSTGRPTETRSEGATHKVFDTLVVLVCLVVVVQHLFCK